MLGERTEPPMKERLETATVGDIVAADFRAAGVFEQFGIDFCCGGRRSLSDACQAASADPAALVRALDALPPRAADDDVTRWPLERLVDHITTEHHAYVRAALPAIAHHLAKLREAHGARHPELTRVASAFERMRVDLEQHLLKEEQVVFPYIRDLAEQAREPCGVLRSP